MQADAQPCPNWADDQLVVIDLLNSIAVPDGGAGGSLNGTINGRFVAGTASEALCHAIATFESRQFPGQCSGVVEPDGRLLARMEALAMPDGYAVAKRAGD
jgi:hypothetical protein